MTAVTTEATIADPGEFIAWPKTFRLHKDCVITEKIDGTNGQIYITKDGDVYAGSRNRWLSLGSDDNFGFARWVAGNADELRTVLGPGRHYGEWYGSGVQRGYGLAGKRFALFNTSRWGDETFPTVEGLETVPVLFEGQFASTRVVWCLLELEMNGSSAAPGFAHPEGVVIYHTAARQCFKAFVKDLGNI